MLRIVSANLNGIRSAAGKGFFPWLAAQRADVACVQELKAQVSSGEYEPDLNKVASSLLKFLVEG